MPSVVVCGKVLVFGLIEHDIDQQVFGRCWEKIKWYPSIAILIGSHARPFEGISEGICRIEIDRCAKYRDWQPTMQHTAFIQLEQSI
jgi:hypothetical protein